MQKKCSNCNSSNMILGDIQTADSLNLYFVSKEESKRIFPKSKKLISYLCANCGKVDFYTVDSQKE